MAEIVQVAAFESGALRLLVPEAATKETVLSLSMSRLLAAVVRVPAENRDDSAAFALPVLKARNPYPDDILAVSCEIVRESEDETVVIAAALPESSAEDIAGELDAHKLNVTRIDLATLGLLRGLWPTIGVDERSRKLVVIPAGEEYELVVLDGDLPVALRSVPGGGEFDRETLFLLQEAEDFNGPRQLAEMIYVTSAAAAAADERLLEAPKRVQGLLSLAGEVPLRTVEVGADAALVGVAERSLETACLNALPASWGEVLGESRFKAKLMRSLAVAGGVWLLLAAVLFGVPLGYSLLADRQRELSKEHARVYAAVKDTRDKVKVVQKYSDHSRGALEVMKALSDRLPEGIVLSSWNFRREEGVKVSGEAESASGVYDFKNRMTELCEEVDGEEGEAVFKTVVLTGPSAGRNNTQKFDLECRYEAEEEE